MKADRPLTDAEVVRRVRDGETALFELLMRRHNQRLYRVTRAILRDDAEAEDAMQQSYLAAYAHLDRFDGQSAFSTWLVGIARHEALTRLRRRRRQARLARLDELERGEERRARVRSPEEDAAMRQLGVTLERAIDALPAIYREVFVLREVEGLDTEETARCLGIREEAVKVRLHRARHRLRDELAADAAPREAFVFLGHRCDRVVARVLAAIGASTRA